MEVRWKAINIALTMTSSWNVEDIVLFLKKQLQKTQEQDFEKVRNIIAGYINLNVLHARLLSTDNFSFSPSMSPPSSFPKWRRALCMH
jgi:hypothetical protein